MSLLTTKQQILDVLENPITEEDLVALAELWESQLQNNRVNKLLDDRKKDPLSICNREDIELILRSAVTLQKEHAYGTEEFNAYRDLMNLADRLEQGLEEGEDYQGRRFADIKPSPSVVPGMETAGNWKDTSTPKPIEKLKQWQGTTITVDDWMYDVLSLDTGREIAEKVNELAERFNELEKR